MGTLLTVKGLSIGFRQYGVMTNVIHGIDLAIQEGERVGIVGESGSGKSLTARSIIRLLPIGAIPTVSKLQFKDLDLQQIPERRMRSVRGSRIGFVAQNPFGALNPVMRVWRQFARLYASHGAAGAKAEWRQRTEEILRSVGLDEAGRVADAYPHELSGGMAQRVVIAMAVALEPELLVADEPTTALDLTVQKRILAVLDRVTHTGTRSLLLVTHDLGVVTELCERVYVMYQGRFVETGPTLSVLRHPQHPYTEMLVNSMPSRLRDIQREPGGPGTPRGAETMSQGCGFAPRCPYAFDRCTIEVPALESRESECLAACFHERLPDRPVGSAMTPRPRA